VPVAIAAVVEEWQQRPRSVLFLASNCRDKSGRLAFVRALSVNVAVDSPGACLHNISVADLVRA